MKKEKKKDRILSAGAQLIYSSGFTGTGLQQILEAAGVPKGSFYYYFKSKEDFGLRLVDHFYGFIEKQILRQIGDTSLAPRERLRSVFVRFKELQVRLGCTGGCPIGNLSQEMCDVSEAFREKLREVYDRMKEPMEACIAEGQRQGQFPSTMPAGDLARFFLNSWEGALIEMKLTRSVEPLEVFERIAFSNFPQADKGRSQNKNEDLSKTSFPRRRESRD